MEKYILVIYIAVLCEYCLNFRFEVTNFEEQRNLGKKVLVVGHSNTTPDFVNKVLGEEIYSQMDENNNSSLFIVTVVGNQASANELNFNINVQ